MKLNSIIWIVVAGLLAGCGKNSSGRGASESERSTTPSAPEQRQFIVSLASFHQTVSSLAAAYASAQKAKDLASGLQNNSGNVMNMKGSDFIRQAGALSGDVDRIPAAQLAVESALSNLWTWYAVLESNNWAAPSIERFLGSKDLSDLSWLVWAPTVQNVQTASRDLLAELAEASAWTRNVDGQGAAASGQELDASAQFELGRRYAIGSDVEWNSLVAARWFRKAAEQNHPGAQVSLGSCFAKGFGVAQDYEAALIWFRKAAEQDFAEAHYHLGNCYANGNGVVKDHLEAVKWYRKAAEQNFAPAQVRMGDCYCYGHGFAKDQVEAARWYHRAAEQGDSFGKWALGGCYHYGNGVALDKVEAFKWYYLAAIGDTESSPWSKAIGSLKEEMTRAQIAEGERRASDWLAQRKVQ